MSGRQLGLPFEHDAHYADADFLQAPSNAEAWAWLDAPWPGGRLAIWGAEASGKTHLLHIWARRAGAAVLHGPCLRGWQALRGPVAIDDADLRGADLSGAEALLHLLNAAAEAGWPVLLGGREPPARWAVRLPDLASRLRATSAVRLGVPDDALLRALLARLLSERQLAVAAPVQEWLLQRLPRQAGAVREAVARLDRAALAAGGPVTRGLAQAVLPADLESFAEEAGHGSPGDALLL